VWLHPCSKNSLWNWGGKTPNIIFTDADIDKAVDMSIHSSFSNQGQICLCGSRIMVEKSIYPIFLEKFIAKTKTLQVGDPQDPKTNIGAVVSEAHMLKILSCIELAKTEGGKIEWGGTRKIMSGNIASGFYIEPTIITGLSQTCRTNQEEIFGPVVTVMPFDTEKEAITMANSTKYGLSATIWTENLSKAHRVAHQIESGIVWINTWLLRDLRTPFGGVKQSGVGREGGFEAFDFFTEPQNICVRL
jgi:aminomuconate-semialdehyde/2-hydroxymuconate-6-semialdehyde dehydrogenase